METGANKDEGQSRRRHKEEARRSEWETSTGKNKNGGKCGWFVWERILYVDLALLPVPPLFPCCCCCCCFPFFFAPLSFVPFTLSSLGAICLPSVSPVMLQMAFVRDVGDHRGFLFIWPWHALLLSARSLMRHMQESLDPRPLLLMFGRPWSPLVSRCSRRHYCEPLFGTSRAICISSRQGFPFAICREELPTQLKAVTSFPLFFSREWWGGSLITVEQLQTQLRLFFGGDSTCWCCRRMLLFGSITIFLLLPFRRETHRADENVIICLNNSSKGRN